jgi:hypothetical protein
MVTASGAKTGTGIADHGEPANGRPGLAILLVVPAPTIARTLI